MPKLIKALLLFFIFPNTTNAQQSFPVNGVVDIRNDYFAFTHATIVKDAHTQLQNATMVIRQGKILLIGTNINIPKEAAVIDCKGKFIYPSFIDLFSDYGIPVTPKTQRSDIFQNLSNKEGAYGWNQAIRPETNAADLFSGDNEKAASLRKMGFGAVVSHQQDGIARGTGVLVALGSERDNLVVLKENAAAFYSFSRGSSTQDYPTSLMGAIALLRQTYLDAQWYKNRPVSEGTNLSLEAWNNTQNIPQIFDANDKWNDLRASKIAQEFQVQYIIKGGGNEYQRIDEIKDTKASYILPINFPLAIDVQNPDDARLVTLSTLKHWEMAPSEPGIFEKQNIPFTLTASGLKSDHDFFTNIQKAIDAGLSPSKALESLTQTPAMLLGVYDKMGSLDEGKLANFFITNGPVFDPNTFLFQNWVSGKKYIVEENGWMDLRGNYTLTINNPSGNDIYTVEIGGKAEKADISLKSKTDTSSIKGKINIDGNVVKITWNTKTDPAKMTSLSGIAGEKVWTGSGYDTQGNRLSWNMQLIAAYIPPKDKVKKAEEKETINTTVMYPFDGYGWTEKPLQKMLLIKNATVWTNEPEGILENTDVLVNGGKIQQIGKNLTTPLAGKTPIEIIDGTGKYLTAGIIDEHSHIAISGGVNECSQSVTAEVRVGDVINPEDIDIYRQLAGGVTTSHLLHGSCNTIGGQTQLIKLRWGSNAEDLKFANWDPFIKFALGENVKRSSSNNNQRFPNTRMGVEQVLMDAFTRAQDYDRMGTNKRRDLELDALSEILHHKRFITCHSYVQSEINMLMHVADTFGFTVNTFTHVLEGYKIADKLKVHGANVATFSDWWAYKSEVQDAIAYNAAIMQKVGLNVAINSDDAEMARRLNQESAKTIKYGNLSEAEAWKMCTLNPAKMLHIADRVGSIKEGKDADLVLWTANPLSVYAKAEKTIVDGIVYFDLAQDAQLRQRISAERNRLIQKMIHAKNNGSQTTPATVSFDNTYEDQYDDEQSNNFWRIKTEEIQP
ncbi:MAG: amidohydrolase family protein [Bacteroidetes bacterium]|nr:amidohydrolase family protein [Bacteroidota bacterium]